MSLARKTMSIATLEEVRLIVGDVLELGPRTAQLRRDTPLLGNLPELDSMAVVSVLSALEEHFGITIHDDEVSAEAFETLGSLIDLLNQNR
jgi:acyl carrier protein